MKSSMQFKTRQPEHLSGSPCHFHVFESQEMCSKAFGGKELSTTMNADECVARGLSSNAACKDQMGLDR